MQTGSHAGVWKRGRPLSVNPIPRWAPKLHCSFCQQNKTLQSASLSLSLPLFSFQGSSIVSLPPPDRPKECLFRHLPATFLSSPISQQVPDNPAQQFLPAAAPRSQDGEGIFRAAPEKGAKGFIISRFSILETSTGMKAALKAALPPPRVRRVGKLTRVSLKSP